MAKNSGIKFTPKLDQSGIGEFKRSVDQLLKSIKDSKTLQIKNIELMKSAEASFKRSVNEMLKRVGSEVGVTIDNVKISDRAMSGIQNAVKNATSSLTKVDLSAVNKEIARMDAELTKMGQSIADKANFIDADSIKQAEAEYQKLLAMMQAVKNMSGTDRQAGAATLSTQIALMQQLITYRSVEAEQERQRIALAQAADEATSQAYAKELDAARKQLEALSVSAKSIQFTDQTALTEYGKKWDEVAQAILRARELTGEDAAQAVTAIHAQITELQGLVNANNEAALAAKERAAAEQEAANAQNSILKSYESRLAKVGVGTKTSDLFTKDGLDGYISKIQEINDLISRAKTETGEAKQATMDQINAEISALENAVIKRRAELEAAKEQAAADKEAARSAEARAKQIAGLEGQTIGLNGDKALRTGNADHIANYKERYKELLDMIQQAKSAESTDDGVIQKIREKINELKKLKEEYNNAAQASRNASSAEAERDRLQANITNTLHQLNSLKINNPGIYKAYTAEIDDFLTKLQAGSIKSQSELDGIRNRIREIADESKDAGIAGKSFFQQLKAGWEKFGGWSLVTRSFTKVISTFKQAVQAVKEIDEAMTELRKVTDLTEQGYQKFYDTAVKSAKQVGAKVSDIIQSTADFARLGFSTEQASELSKAAMTFLNVGDGISDVSFATESLISTMKAFGIEAENAMSIVDKFNEVGNNFAISSSGIGEALQRSAAALSLAGNTIEESIGLIVAANDVVQNPESVGTAMKTLTMYLRAAKTEAEDAGIATDGMAESTAKLREELKSLTGGKLDIMQLDGKNFKSSFQILKELSEMWDEIGRKSGDVTQANILNLLGGKRNANVLSSIIKNFQDAIDAMETASHSTGSAMLENAKYLDSIQGKTKQLEASFQAMANSIIDSGLVKAFVDIARSIADAVTWLNKWGLAIPVLTTIVGLVKTLQTTITASKATTSIIDILSSKEGTVTQKIDSIKKIFSGLGTFAKQLVGNNMLGQIRKLNLGEDLAGEVQSLGESMRDTSAKALSFEGAIASLKARLSGFGSVLKSITKSWVGKFAIGVSAAIAIVAAAKSAYESYANSVIENSRNVLEKHEEVVESVKSGKKTLDDMKDEYDVLSKGVDDYGNNVTLTDEEYARYLQLCQQIIDTVPSLKNAYSEKGKALKEGYVDILVQANEELEKLAENEQHQQYIGAKKTAEGIQLEVNQAIGSDWFGGVTGVNVRDHVSNIVKWAVQAGLEDGSKDGGKILKRELDKIQSGLYDEIIKVSTADSENIYVNQKAVYLLRENVEALASAYREAGADTTEFYTSFGFLDAFWNTYSEKLRQYADLMKIVAMEADATKDIYADIAEAGGEDTFYKGLYDVLDPSLSYEDNLQATIRWAQTMSEALSDMKKAQQDMANGATPGMAFNDLMEKYGGFPALVSLFEKEILGVKKAEDEAAEGAESAAKSYAELAKAMDDVTKAASFLEKARSGDKSSFDMLKEAQDFVDAYNAILDEDMESIDVGDLFETADDGTIKWNTKLIEQYSEEIIRAKFANSELAEENPELVDALVNEALSLDLVKKSALDLAEALSQVNNISDINDSINDYLSKGSEATAADKLAIITDVDEIIAKWNELGRARAELSEDGEEWVDITREDFFGESLDNMDLAKQKMAEYGEFILDVFSEGDTDNPLVAMLRSVMTTSNKATKEVYSLKDAVSSLKDVASKRFEGFDLTDVSGSIEEATNMANDWNDALKQIGKESEANKTWMDFLEIGDDGKLKEKADALRLMYEDVIDAVLSSIKGLTDEQKASMRQSMIDQFVSEQDAKNAEERAEKISDAFGDISSAFSYLEKHANDEKVGDGFYDALNEFYQLREKFGKEGEWSFSDFFEWNGEDFTYKTDALKTAVTSMAEEIAQDLTDSMLQSGKITEDQVEDTYKRIKDSIVNSMTEAKEEIDGLGDAISNAKSINSFLADVNAEDSNLLDLLASAEDLADKLGMDMGKIVKIDAMGKLTFDTEALVAQFNSYIDELVAAGEMSEDLGKQIKEAAAAEKELADNAKTAAERMADALSSMQSVAGNLNTALGGDSDILSMLGNADQMAKAWNDAFGDTFASKKDTFDFLLFDGDTVRENQKALKDMYSKLATDYINNYVIMRKEAIEKARKAKEITEEDADDELAALETIRAELEAKLVPAFDAYIEQLERANELSKSADVSSTISEVYDYINAVNSGTMTFTDAYSKALSLMEKMPDAKLEDFFEIGEDGSISFANGIEMLTKWLNEYLATEVEAGHISQSQADALVKEAEAAAKAASAYEALNNAISNVKSVSSYLEGAKAANSGTGNQSFVDMLQSALGLLEQMGDSYTLEDFFRFDPDGNIQYETDVLLDWSDKMIDNLVEQQKLSADFAEQLKLAARAEQQAATAAQRVSTAYNATKERASFGSGLARGGQLSYADYNAMMEANPKYAESIEYVNGVLTVNRDKYWEITEAMAEETAQMALLEAAQRKLKYEDLENQLKTRTDLTDDVRKSMQKEIDKLKLEAKGYMVLANEISNATNQFERFRAASGNTDADTYMDAQSALKMINDVMYNTESELYGRFGNEKFQEAVRLLVNPEIDFNDPEWMAQVEEARARLEKYFGEGDEKNPQTSRTNMNALWKDLLSGDFASVTVDETGKQWGQLNGTVDDIAKSFGMTKDAVRAALQELQTFSGVNFDWEHIDPEYYQEVIAKAEELARLAEEAQAKAEASKKEAEDARAKADEAAAKLEEAQKGNDQDAIELAKAEADAAEQNAQAAERAAQEAKDAADAAAKNAADKEATGTEELKKSLEEILADVEKLKTEKIEIDCESAIESTTTVTENLEKIVGLIEQINNVNAAMEEVGATTDETQGKVDTLGESEVDVDTNPAIWSLDNLESAINSAENEVAYLSSTFIDLDENPAIGSIQSVLDALAVLSAAIDDVNRKKIAPSTSGGPDSGSGSGDGGGSGARGIKSSPGGKTLVGELGREIVVDVNSGRWYTVGNNGPEFVNLPRHAIVYNAQKTAELLGERKLDLSGLSMAAGTNGNSGVSGGMINISALETPIKEAEKKVTGAIEQEEETLSDKLDAIKEAYDLANETLNHLIEHEEFNYYGAERAANYDKMHTYLANEVEIYKAIMKNSQEGIEALKAAGATDGDEQLQELEEAYWSAYRSMYEVLDNIRDLYTSALSDEVDNIQNAFKNLTDAAKEYNSTGKISIDTFQALLDGGVQYLGLLQDENGEFDVSETSVRNLLKMRKDQLAIETAIAYVDRIREALRNGEVNKVNELANATGQIGRSTWSLVYAQLELARAEGLTNEQYQAALTNLQNLQKLAAVAMDDFDSEDKIAEAKENFEALKKEIEHYIKHQEFSFDVSERAMDFKGMNKALDNEVAYYKQIMADAQATIAEMTREGADDTNENLQAVEEAYWSAYRSMYDTIDKIRALRVDALTDRLNGLTSAFSTLKQASDEYNKAGGISLDTFESLLSQGFEYMSLLDEENGKYVIAKDRISQYVQMRKNQLAIESALSYISKVREALENNEEERLQNLLKVQDMVSGSTWSMVYAQAALLKTQGLSNEQYETLIANLKKMQTLADSVVDTIASGEEDITEEYDKQKDAMSDILSYTEDLIRAETKERMDAIKDQIDAYKEIIDLKKKSLDETKNENEYQDSVAEKVKAIAELQAKADLLSLDTSRNAAVERQKLLDQIAEKQKELGKYQGDHALDAQKDALDAEYEAYEETRQAEIDELEKTISSEEKVYQLAIARIRDQWDTLYQDLIAWNTESGSVINQEITDAWEAATAAVQKYGSAVSALQEFTGNKPANYVVADIMKYHSGGIVGDEGSINDHEVVAILEKDELVVTKPMKKALYTAIDFVKSLGERLGTNVDKIRNFSVEGLRGQMIPAFAGASTAPVSQNNQINFSPNISVEFNGVDINGRDAASFGRDIANAAADNLFEAFTRRGIDAIRTLRQ